MLSEVLAGLLPKPGGRYLDGTVGGGGHARAILEASSPSGWLFGCDRDAEAIAAANCCLQPFQGRFEIRHQSFTGLEGWIPRNSLDGVLLDLGVSSAQLDHPERGFSFQVDAPLDMRMDARQSLTAAEVVAQYAPDELARIFWEYGGERESRSIARAIDRERQKCPIRTTGQLAALVSRRKPRFGRGAHPATKVFQALRMEVNDESASLKKGLAAGWAALAAGGRMVVITFHSGEDREAKQFSQTHARDYRVVGEVDLPEFRTDWRPDLKILTRKALKPSEAEIQSNPRARSAQVRIWEKTYVT